jgi:hypothetical protein
VERKRFVYLTTASSAFHGRVLAARLGAEGILVELRGFSDGPYPLWSPVEVFVPDDQVSQASELLLADAVDEVYAQDPLEEGEHEEAQVLSFQHRRTTRLWGIAVTLVLVAILIVRILH